MFKIIPIALSLAIMGSSAASATIPANVVVQAPKSVQVADAPTRTFGGGGPAPITITVKTIAPIGDSISDFHAIQWGPDHNMWTRVLNSGPVVVNQADGWVKGGARLRDMAAAMAGHPVTSDYLVVEGGTNDGGPGMMGLPGGGTPRTEAAAELVQIVTEANIPANRVYISAAAPLNSDVGDGSMAWWNTEEQALAAQYGWHYFDAFAGLRQPNGGPYIPAYTFDGIHPTDDGAIIMAQNIAEEVTNVH